MICAKGLLGRGKSKCKGPEVGTILVTLENSKNSRVTGRAVEDRSLTGVAGGRAYGGRPFSGLAVKGSRKTR